LKEEEEEEEEVVYMNIYSMYVLLAFLTRYNFIK